MVALLIVADQYGLNPWTKEIYAFPGKGGSIIPVVGVDGWSRIINTNPKNDGVEFEYSDEMVTSESGEHRPCPAWVKCIIYRKDRDRPTSVTEFFDECYRGKMGNPPVDGAWQTHPKRFLRHKATIQCSRLAFGFVGIFDQDEAERIVEAEVVSIQPRRSTSVTKDVIDDSNLQVDEQQAADYVERLKEHVFEQDDMAILQLYEEMDSDMILFTHGMLDSKDRTYIREVRHAEDQGAEHEPAESTE